MNFETGHLYHIYNQRNNRQKLFFSRKNYLYFLQKIAKHITPSADILAWCLMPNHFHFLVFVKDEVELAITHQMTSSHLHTLENIGSVNRSARASGSATQSRTPTNNNLNKSIGIMLASYSRAIYKQENISGSIFRDKTKAICLTKAEKITPSYYNSTFGTYMNISIPEREYPQLCFDYILNNPVKANLVKHAKDLEFSSYKDYFGLRNGKLINKERTNEFGLINGSDTHQMTSI